MNLVEMLGRLSESGAERGAALLPEAARMRLREAGRRFAEQKAGPRFRVGDFITPVSDANVKGQGEPHLVVEVKLGAEPDLRVLYLRQDRVLDIWLNSREFELWFPPATGAAHAD
jgi:hypothetical protein